MDRKQAKKDRTKRFFLDAAKDIIRSEGVDKLTTKKIGEKAAYSYASIYNYFENFNDLICQCLEEMAEESVLWMTERIQGSTPPQRILSFAHLMVEANAAEPNGYSVFLSTNIDYEYFQRRDGHPYIHPAYALLRKELQSFPELSEDGERGEAKTVADILTYIFHSKLHFYIRYKSPPTLDQLHAEIEEEARFILDRLQE